MKTSKEMQLKIIDKMRENIVDGLPICENIQYWSEDDCAWQSDVSVNNYSFNMGKYRIKPETITINGVEIPKPIDIKDIDTTGNYYFPQCHEEMYGMLKGLSILQYNVFYPYATEEEAIQASKALFGIDG